MQVVEIKNHHIMLVRRIHPKTGELESGEPMRFSINATNFRILKDPASEVLKLSIISYQPEGARDEYRAIDQNNYDGAPDGNNAMGHGETALEAVADLIEQLEVQG